MEECPICNKKGMYSPSIQRILELAIVLNSKNVKKLCKYCNYKEFY